MKVQKMICAFAVAVMATVALAAGNWQGQVTKAAQDSSVLKEAMQGLSNADQLALFKAVNTAISKSAASPTEKANKYVEAERAAVAAANADNKTAMIAEAFATVPPEGLTAVNEALSADVKAAGGDQAKMANEVVDAVISRCKTADNAGARETFSILSFVRNDAALQDGLVSKLDAETQDLAKNEWIDPALKGDYNPILGATNADQAPELAQVNSLAMPSSAVASALAGIGGDSAKTGAMAGGELFAGEDGTLPGMGDIWIFAKPRFATEHGTTRFGAATTDDGKVEFDPGTRRGHKSGADNDGPTPGPPPHPHPYAGQVTGW